MNVLMTSINYDHMDHVFAEIFRQITPNSCAVTFLDLESKERFPQTKAYANYAFCYQQCRNGWYKSQLFYNELPPLDSNTIDKMTPYERDILLMLTRERPYEHRLVVREYYKHLRYWNYILDKLNIDIYLSFMIPHESYDAVIHALCKVKKIPVVCLNMSNILEYLYMVTDVDDPCPELKQKYSELKKNYSNMSLDEIQFSDARIKEKYMKYTNPKSDLTPIYMKPIKETQKQNKKITKKKDMILRRLNFIRLLTGRLLKFNSSTLKKVRNNNYFDRAFLEYEILLNYYNEHCSPLNEEDKYIYVPLHLQPEFTTAPVGHVFADQVLMVKMLSYYLPDGYFLYVKEHPGQQRHCETFPAGRHIEFYQDLVELENVKLIDIREDTYSLIRNSLAIASVTGTAGFEAIARGKHFLMFGHQITQYAPGVFPVRTNSDCENAIRKVTGKGAGDMACTTKDFKLYLKSIEETCFYGTFWYEPIYYNTLSREEITESETNIITNYVQRINTLLNQKSSLRS